MRKLKYLSYVLILIMLSCNQDEMSKLEKKGTKSDPALRSVITQSELDAWNIGIVGIDLTTGKEDGKSCAFDPTTRLGTDDRTENGYTINKYYIESSSELQKIFESKLDIGIKGSFWGVSVNASFEKELLSSFVATQNSVYMLVKCDYIDKSLTLNAGEFRPNAKALLDKKDYANFRATYGDKYLSSVTIGASMYFLYSASTTTLSTYSKEEIKAALEVKYQKIFEGNASYSNSNISSEKLNNFSYSLTFKANGIFAKPDLSTHDDFIAAQNNFKTQIVDQGFRVPVRKVYTDYPGYSTTLYLANLSNKSYWVKLRSDIFDVYNYLLSYKPTDAINISKCISTLNELDVTINNFDPSIGTIPLPNVAETKYQEVLNIPKTVGPLVLNYNRVMYYTHTLDGTHYMSLLNSDNTYKNFEWQGGKGVAVRGWFLADIFGCGRDAYVTFGNSLDFHSTLFNGKGVSLNYYWSGAHGVADGGWSVGDLFGNGVKMYYTHSSNGMHYATRFYPDGTFRNYAWSGGHGIGDGGWTLADLFGTGRKLYYTHTKQGEHFATQLNEDGTVVNYHWTSGHGVGAAGWRVGDVLGDGTEQYYTKDNGCNHFITKFYPNGTLKNYQYYAHGIADGGWDLVDVYGKGKKVYTTHSRSGTHYVTQFYSNQSPKMVDYPGGHGVASQGWAFADLFGDGSQIYWTHSDRYHYATKLTEDGRVLNYSWVGPNGVANGGFSFAKVNFTE